MTTLGILVGGGPAPGINGVIGAATIAAERSGVRVLGLLDGFKWLIRGQSDHVTRLRSHELERVHLEGGSILRTSRANPMKRAGDLDRVVDTLADLGVDRLVTIGGDDTATSAFALARHAGERLRVVHVPKTIDNDLPLPAGIPTFGFETAREQAARIVAQLVEDARTTQRWYFVVVMGRKAGHLALGAGKAAGANLTLIPEDWAEGPIALEDIVRTLEGAIVKALADGREDGVAVIAEGMGERLEASDLDGLDEVERDEHGHIRLAEVPLGSLLRDRVRSRLRERGIELTIGEKNVGYELRCAPPNAFDLEYTRDLGAGAVKILLEGGTAALITRQNGAIVALDISALQDPETGRTRVRLVDPTTDSHACGATLQRRLEASDLRDDERLGAIASAAGLEPGQAREYFASVV